LRTKGPDINIQTFNTHSKTIFNNNGKKKKKKRTTAAESSYGSKLQTIQNIF